MTHDQGQRCACVAEHRPAPLELHRHHILPLAAGGADEPDNVVWLCPSGHVSTHELLRIIVARNGRLTWTEATGMYEQTVSRYAFALAHEGWRRMAARFAPEAAA